MIRTQRGFTFHSTRRSTQPLYFIVFVASLNQRENKKRLFVIKRNFHGTNEPKKAEVTSIEQEQIFEAWLNKYKALIFKIVRAYAFTVADQDDLFQEIALQIWRSVPSFQKASSVTTWVYRVAINTAIKWVRKERKHQGVKEISPVLCLQPDNTGVADERLDWLYQEIHKLDKIDRSLSLLLLDGLSYKEMSDILGITESNVGVKISRIKKQLIAKSLNYTSYGI